jgi:hypothetical protein
MLLDEEVDMQEQQQHDPYQDNEPNELEYTPFVDNKPIILDLLEEENEEEEHAVVKEQEIEDV